MILSPSAAADAELIAHGARAEQLWRWQPGVDPECFGPGHYSADILPRVSGQINVLHIGIPEQPGLLDEAFGIASAREPRLRLVIAGDGADLPALYASADLLAYLRTTPEFPLEIVEAQASGLPVLALDAGAATELIEDGRNGVLIPNAPPALAEALISLARRATLRERLTVGGLSAVRGRSWNRSLTELASAWAAAMAPAESQMMRAA
jgi:glycosyltransferase involved in cell wall biosynthesis